jgi:tricarballylate dehydrogenase
MENDLSKFDFDIVIVGAGIAGCSAAASAAEQSKKANLRLRILIVERADKNNWGGNSRWTGALFRMLDEETLYPKIEEEFLSYSEGKINKALIKTFLENAIDSVKWLKSKGVEFEKPQTHYIAQKGSYIRPRGGGLSAILTLMNYAMSMGVQVVYETTAFKLNIDEEGRINGIWVRDKSGVGCIKAPVVILASGGFEGNEEMLCRYLGSNALKLKMYSPGEKYNKGEGIKMIEEIGGKLSGDFCYIHGGPADTRSNSIMPLVDIFPYGIIVNKLGQRFVDEGTDYVDDAANIIALNILRQPDNIAYLILDSKFKSIPKYERAILTDKPPIEANSINELAKLLGISFDSLLKTINDFNNSVQEGEFNPFIKDGKCTKGIDPPKSNWALRIDKPPFYAYPLSCALSHTVAGVAINNKAQVLSNDDIPIEGLYAAGEIVGFDYFKYVPGTSFFRGLVFGRIAGKEAVEYLIERFNLIKNEQI